jgi:hypothetical protein
MNILASYSQLNIQLNNIALRQRHITTQDRFIAHHQLKHRQNIQPQNTAHLQRPTIIRIHSTAPLQLQLLPLHKLIQQPSIAHPQNHTTILTLSIVLQL